MKILYLAYRNIISKPLNLVLSIVLFGLGISLINFLILFNDQLKNKFDKNLAGIDLVIGAKGSPLQMILSSMYHIDSPTGNISIGEAKAFLNPRHPLIKAAVPLSLGDSYKSYRIVGSTDSIFSFYHAEIEQGSIHQKNFEVTIGKVVAEDTGLKVGDNFKSAHGFNDDEDLVHDDASFKVTGILKGTGSAIDQLIVTNLSTVWNVHSHVPGLSSPNNTSEEEGHAHDHSEHAAEENHEQHDHEDEYEHKKGTKEVHGHDSEPFARTNADLLKYPDRDITSILIKYKNRTDFRSLSMPRAINENTDLQAASPAIEINRLYSMIGVGRQMIQWLAMLIALISAITIFIVLYKSMRERKYELALIRVMGSSRTSLFSLIIIEGMILTAIGYIVGLVLSHVGMGLLAGSLKSSYKYSFTGYHFMKEEFYLMGVSLTIGILAALIPAMSAAKMDIHKTLSSK